MRAHRIKGNKWLIPMLISWPFPLSALDAQPALSAKHILLPFRFSSAFLHSITPSRFILQLPISTIIFLLPFLSPYSLLSTFSVFQSILVKWIDYHRAGNWKIDCLHLLMSTLIPKVPFKQDFQRLVLFLKKSLRSKQTTLTKLRKSWTSVFYMMTGARYIHKRLNKEHRF